MNERHPPRTRFAALLAALTLVAGCATYRALPNGDWPKIESGDDLRVTTHAGELHEFRVEAVQDETLRSEALELPFTDIAWIERREANAAAKPLLLIAGGVLLTYAVLSSSFDFSGLGE